METVNICEAKIRLGELADKAAAGEDVVLSHHGRPVARITRLETPRRRVKFGLLKGKIRISLDFDAPVPPLLDGRVS